MAASIEAKELGGELMLYHPERDEIHVLNPTARLVYESHRQGKSLSETERALREEFRVPEEQDVRGELEGCLAMLRDKGLIDG